MRKFIAKQRKLRHTISLVPTMGALHEGHTSLIEIAKKKADIVIVSIFINHKQFDNSEDLLKYPQLSASDLEILKYTDVDALFLPVDSEIYPKDFITEVKMSGLTENLCGKTRSGHFDGVALIVAKLFNITTPDIAIFGEKDFQQLQIIRKLVVDLSFNIKIITGKTIREKNGLAKSSRNQRLTDSEQEIASQIYQTLTSIRQQILDSKNNHLTISTILSNARRKLLKSGFEKIDYLEICEEENLQPIKNIKYGTNARIFVAIYLGSVRLIDNIAL